MTDKVQKIREEVERLKLCTMDEHMKFYSDAAEAEYNALYNIEHFIDSLQEDHNTSDWLQELEKMPDEQVKERLEKVNAWYNEQFANKEPVNEDLEEAVNAYIGYAPDVDESSSVYGNRQAFKAGAKWKEEQFEKNRLAACDRQTEEEAEIELDFVMEIIEKEHRQPTFNDAIKYGMKLHKEQMMAKAIDAHCFGFQGAAALFSFRLPAGIHLVGSKVKVIVIKEE